MSTSRNAISSLRDLATPSGVIAFWGRYLRHKDVDRAIDENPMALNELGYDPWGYHPESAKVLYGLARLIHNYFRPVVHGIENIPNGRVLIVPNHSGQLPYDALVVATACLLNARPPRLVRAMVERWTPTVPFINQAFMRAGCAVGDPINCRNLLEAENAILVFPEGARGCGKTWAHRYQLTRFGLGFMRLALEAKAPIVPVAVIGAEESIPSLYDLKPLAKLLGAPYIPVPALLPILGPLALLPLPVRMHIYFGQPVTFEGPADDEDEVIERHVQVVVERIQELIDRGLRERKSVF
jgi:1-acyl-sn-glycerol-3-phosphate acyltransferase